MAVPPLAETLSEVELATLPPSTATVPFQVSPTPMALPALPPLFTSPIATAPPLAEAVATPPLPAEAVSVNCIALCPPLCPPRPLNPTLGSNISRSPADILPATHEQITTGKGVCQWGCTKIRLILDLSDGRALIMVY